MVKPNSSLNENVEEVNLLNDNGDNILNNNEYIVDISCGQYHSLILTNLGYVYCVGNNKYGQVGDIIEEYEDYSDIFRRINFESDDVFITEIKAGYFHNLFLDKNGNVYANGSNVVGQINGNSEDINKIIASPTKIELKEKAVKIYCSNYKNCVKLESGKHVYWGGFLYTTDYIIQDLPKIDGFNVYEEEKDLIGKEIVDVGIGLHHEIVITKEPYDL